MANKRRTHGTYIWEKNGKVYARVPYQDQTGKRKYKTKLAENKSHAKRLAQELLDEIETSGTNAANGFSMTFEQFADWYAANYLVAARYSQEQKVAGLRSAEQLKKKLAFLKTRFHAKTLRNLRYSDLYRFKIERLGEPVGKANKPRSVASVNRELALLRAMLNVAFREGFVKKNPFNAGENLINSSLETQRTRVLSRVEEKRLLEACGNRELVYERQGKEVKAVDQSEKRRHLRTIIICALDTGMRKTEILNLEWMDLDLEKREIIAKSYKGKRLTVRTVGITKRLLLELTKLRNESDGDSKVFPFDDVKRSFNNAVKAANIDDLHFHDLRHTTGTRLVERGLGLSEVARILGHSTITMSYRYLNRTENTQACAVELLEQDEI